MLEKTLNKLMETKNNGKLIMPLKTFEVNGTYIIGVYQGSLSEYDILIKYRQKQKDRWSRIRTPKHIHWTVDMLIKLNEDKIKTKEFLNFLLRVWDQTSSITTKSIQKEILNPEKLLRDCRGELTRFESLNTKGEYSIKFLILLAKLLMIQEKTNRKDAFMFKKLLTTLKEYKDLFSAISVASHR